LHENHPTTIRNRHPSRQRALSEALCTLMRWARDPQLSFSWFDAAIAANQIRNQYQGASR